MVAHRCSYPVPYRMHAVAAHIVSISCSDRAIHCWTRWKNVHSFRARPASERAQLCVVCFGRRRRVSQLGGGEGARGAAEGRIAFSLSHNELTGQTRLDVSIGQKDIPPSGYQYCAGFPRRTLSLPRSLPRLDPSPGSRPARERAMLVAAAAAAPHHPSTSSQSAEGSSRRSRRTGSSSSRSRMSRVAGLVAAAATALIAATVLAPAVANAQVTALHEPANGQVLFGAWLQTECVHCCCYASRVRADNAADTDARIPLAPLLARFPVDAATPGMLALLLSPDPDPSLGRVPTPAQSGAALHQ